MTTSSRVIMFALLALTLPLPCIFNPTGIGLVPLAALPFLIALPKHGGAEGLLGLGLLVAQVAVYAGVLWIVVRAIETWLARLSKRPRIIVLTLVFVALVALSFLPIYSTAVLDTPVSAIGMHIQLVFIGLLSLGATL